MNKLLTFQTRIPPSNGSDSRDGDPMHSRVPHDLVRGTNNLTYVSPYWGHAQWPPSPTAPTTPINTLHETSTGHSFGRSFLAQLPVVLPWDAYRFCWTLGFYHGGAEFAHAVTITEVTVYISPTPYRSSRHTDFGGTFDSEFFFDTLALPAAYGVSEYDTPISCASGTNEYKFVNMSAGTAPISDWMPFSNPTQSRSALNHAWLIVTFNRETDDVADLTDERVYLADFDWWVSYE